LNNLRIKNLTNGRNKEWDISEQLTYQEKIENKHDHQKVYNKTLMESSVF